MTLQKKNRPWTADDDALLAQLVEARERPVQIARQLGRSLDAVRGRAARLGLVLPSRLRPWRKHGDQAVSPGKANAPAIDEEYEK